MLHWIIDQITIVRKRTLIIKHPVKQFFHHLWFFFLFADFLEETSRGVTESCIYLFFFVLGFLWRASKQSAGCNVLTQPNQNWTFKSSLFLVLGEKLKLLCINCSSSFLPNHFHGVLIFHAQFNKRGGD